MGVSRHFAMEEHTRAGLTTQDPLVLSQNRCSFCFFWFTETNGKCCEMLSTSVYWAVSVRTDMVSRSYPGSHTSTSSQHRDTRMASTADSRYLPSRDVHTFPTQSGGPLEPRDIAASLLRWPNGLVQLFHPLIILDILKPTLSKSLFYRILHIDDASLLEPVQESASYFTHTKNLGQRSCQLTSQTTQTASRPPSPFPPRSSLAGPDRFPDPGTVP